MQEIITAAAQLGKQIAAHPRTRQFLDSARAVAGDSDAQALLRDYQSHMDRIRGLEETGKPIEPDDKRKLAALQQRVATHDKLKTMLRCQADYLELMSRVNQAIESAITD